MMNENSVIRGPDEMRKQELIEEIQVMILFVRLIELDMREFVEKNEQEGTG